VTAQSRPPFFVVFVPSSENGSASPSPGVSVLTFVIFVFFVVAFFMSLRASAAHGDFVVNSLP